MRPGPTVRAALELPQSIEAIMTLCSPAGPIAATQALLSFNSSWIIRWVSIMPLPARCLASRISTLSLWIAR